MNRTRSVYSWPDWQLPRRSLTRAAWEIVGPRVLPLLSTLLFFAALCVAWAVVFGVALR